MTRLETTLVRAAELELQMLVSLTHDGTPSERADSYQRLSALVILSHVQDSGLSADGDAALQRIEAAANELMTPAPSQEATHAE